MATVDDYNKKMGKEMQNIMKHAYALVDATSEELDDQIKSARVALKELLESARADYGETENSLLDKVQAADEFIHVKPYYPIGGAFIAGLLLGCCMSKK